MSPAQIAEAYELFKLSVRAWMRVCDLFDSTPLPSMLDRRSGSAKGPGYRRQPDPNVGKVRSVDLVPRFQVS